MIVGTKREPLKLRDLDTFRLLRWPLLWRIFPVIMTSLCTTPPEQRPSQWKSTHKDCGRFPGSLLVKAPGECPAILRTAWMTNIGSIDTSRQRSHPTRELVNDYEPCLSHGIGARRTEIFLLMQYVHSESRESLQNKLGKTFPCMVMD